MKGIWKVYELKRKHILEKNYSRELTIIYHLNTIIANSSDTWFMTSNFSLQSEMDEMG